MCRDMMFLASTTSEVKNDHANVITQDICNKFIEIKFYVGCMVSQPNHLFQRWTTISLINKINKMESCSRYLCFPSFIQILSGCAVSSCTLALSRSIGFVIVVLRDVGSTHPEYHIFACFLTKLLHLQP